MFPFGQAGGKRVEVSGLWSGKCIVARNNHYKEHLFTPTRWGQEGRDCTCSVGGQRIEPGAWHTAHSQWIFVALVNNQIGKYNQFSLKCLCPSLLVWFRLIMKSWECVFPEYFVSQFEKVFWKPINQHWYIFLIVPRSGMILFLLQPHLNTIISF